MVSGKKVHFVVELPDIQLEKIQSIRELELITSTLTAKGAVSRAIARKVSSEVEQNKRSMYIGAAINRIKARYGNIERFAHEIPENIVDEKDNPVSSSDPTYRTAQEVFLAQSICKSDPKRYLETARRYLDFYRQKFR